jgi:hypothetical protein
MNRLPVVGLLLTAAVLFVPTPAGADGSQASRVRTTAQPIWMVAMDGSRVAYASGGKIHVWNTATGGTSVVKGDYAGASRTANATASELAIAGKRVAWVRNQPEGNTEDNEKLYTASVGGKARLLDHVHRNDVDTDSTTGGWIEGLAGSGKTIAVSTWRANAEVSSDQQLSLVTPTGLRPVTTGPDSIVSQAVDGGLIAVLRAQPWSTSNTVGIYAADENDDAELGEVDFGPLAPDTNGIQVALSGDELVVLTTALQEPDGPTTATLRVYDWGAGQLLHTWPVGIHSNGGEVSFAVHGLLAAVEGSSRLHLVNLGTGKDVTIAKASHTDSTPALDSRGLVYPLNPRIGGPGKLVFVPTAKLLALVS